jgi:hypothetical protein
MHPDLEVQHLIATVNTCRELMARGRFTQAYGELSLGLRRALSMERRGLFFSHELVDLWKTALSELGWSGEEYALAA